MNYTIKEENNYLYKGQADEKDLRSQSKMPIRVQEEIGA